MQDPDRHDDEKSNLAHTATGPRIAAGKKRSRRNALKSGIYATAMFLEGETPPEYRAILDGVLEDLQPVGMLERSLVEKLVTLIWRQRRLLTAESAEIEHARLTNTIDTTLVVEAWDQSRAGEISGGMLRKTSNPIVIEEAMGILNLFRDELKKSGFQKGDSLWPLRKLYGLDHDGEAPFGICHAYQALSMAAENTSRESEKNELKKTMIEILNMEIGNLKSKQNLSRGLAERKESYRSIAVSIPPHMMELVIHCEAHFSREFDRILNQLEQLQRIRRQAAPPSIKAFARS